MPQYSDDELLRDSPFTRLVGERLRRIRQQKQWSLSDVENRSDSEFKASVLGAYERLMRGALKRPAVLAAACVVLATGGLSIPKMGATGFAHDTARRFGLKVTETRPALVPLTLRVPELAGVSLDVVARCGKALGACPALAMVTTQVVRSMALMLGSLLSKAAAAA